MKTQRDNLQREAASACRRGFTLIEMMIYMGLIGTILFSVILFSADFLATGAKSRAYSEATWNSSFPMNRVSSEIREARSYEPTLSTFGTDESVLVLRSSDPTDELITIQKTGTALTVTRGSGSPVPLTPGTVEVTRFRVDDLSFDDRSRNIRVTMEVTSVGDEQLDEQPVITYETTERVRRLEGFGN